MSRQINRAARLWENWEEKEKMLLDVFGNSGLAENLNQQKYDFLSQGINRMVSNTSPDEKMVLDLIKKATVRLEKQLYPHPVVRLFRRIKTLVYDRPVQAARLKKLKTENVLSLSESLTRIGFNGEKLDIGGQLDYDRPKIDMGITAPYGTNHNFNVVLHLEKDQSGQHQLTSYTGTLKDPVNPEKSTSYTFAAESGINAREAVNLLQGRAVLKHYQIGANRMASKWVQLDLKNLTADGRPQLKETGADYEYNLRQEVTKVADVLKKPELDSVTVLNGLEQGNQIAIKQVSGATAYLEADPLGKQVLIRNDARQPTTLEAVLQKRKKELELKPEMKLTKTRTKDKQQGQSMGIS